MGRIYAQHIDGVPWGPRKTGQEGRDGVIGQRTRSKLLGDPDTGPWTLLVEAQPGHSPPAHSHSQDEHMYILKGEMKMGDKTHRAGALVFIEKDTVYSFTAGPEGVTFLNFRSAPASFDIKSA